MKTNPQKEGALTENSAGIGTVTGKMVRERAVELALINGRLAQEVSKSDLEQAKRELTGDPDTDPKEAILESAPESERWDPVPGSTGHKVVRGIRTEDILSRARRQVHVLTPFAKVRGMTITYPAEASQSGLKIPSARRSRSKSVGKARQTKIAVPRP